MPTSALEQARVRHPGVSDADLAVDLAARLADELELTPPVDVRQIASWQGVHEVRTVPLDWSGCITCDGAGRVIISLRSSDSSRRQRFTCCHEVGHTLMPGFRHGAAAYRCTPGADQDAVEQQAVRRGGLSSAQLEALCDLAAAELLLPRRHAVTDLVDAPFGWPSLLTAADRYEASLDATARRWLALSPEPALLLDLRLGTSRNNPRPRLRVHSSQTRGRFAFVPKNKSLRDDHPLQEAVDGNEVDAVCDLADLLLGSELMQLSARLLPFSDGGRLVQRVLVVARPASQLPQQRRARPTQARP